MNKINHNPIFPNPLLCCILGRTNSGKTYLLFHILTNEEKLVDFNELVLYVPKRAQQAPEYLFLKYGFENGLPPSRINALYHVFKASEERPEIIKPLCEAAKEELNKQAVQLNPIPVTLSHEPKEDIFDNPNKTCVVFDDVLGESNQNFQQTLFQEGRHGNCFGFYLAQNFTKLEKNTIRQNTTCYIIFKQKESDLNHMVRNIETSYENKEFNKICKEAWKKDYGYVYINTCKSENEISTNLFP